MALFGTLLSISSLVLGSGGGPGAAAAAGGRHVPCDVVVAGGSTSSLAAAVTAAEADPTLTICFTEITDWPGGQMTAGGVPVIDFDGPNHAPANQPASFRDAMASVPGDGHLPNDTHGSGSPGACKVSVRAAPMPLSTRYTPNRPRGNASARRAGGGWRWGWGWRLAGLTSKGGAVLCCTRTSARPRCSCWRATCRMG